MSRPAVADPREPFTKALMLAATTLTRIIHETSATSLKGT